MKDKWRGTHQLLVYVDDVNLLVRNNIAIKNTNRYNSINNELDEK